LRYIKLKEPTIEHKYEKGIFASRFDREPLAMVCELEDKAICDAIIKYACKNGCTDLLLIDEAFVKSAIIHERIRRGVSAPKRPMEVSDNGMQRWACGCGNLMYKKQKYCDECGQKFNWED
jgi:hypothetical protein